jgi:hypothetical protein
MKDFRPRLFGLFCLFLGVGFVVYSFPHLGEVKPAIQNLLASHNIVVTSLLLTTLVSFMIPALGAAPFPLVLIGFVVGFLPLELLIGAMFAAGVVYSIFGLTLLAGVMSGSTVKNL